MPDISKIKIKTSDSDQGTIYNIKDSKAYDEIANKPGEITTGKQYTIDGQIVTAGAYAEAFNDLTNNKASGLYSHAEGNNTIASGTVSHAEGCDTKASGVLSHAEGNGTTASGDESHAEGFYTTASGGDSHAEGQWTTASGDDSHAEGYYTTASGGVSHAEGYYTIASRQCSHAEGRGTKASSTNQHVQGKYNVEDSNNTYAFIIGNGTADNARHDAFAVDWDGLIYVNGAATGVDVSTLAPQSTTYTKTETDALLDTKADKATVYTDQQRQDGVIESLVDRGAKNIFDIFALKSSGLLSGGTYENNGVTYTLNSDGTISLSGTANQDSMCAFALFDRNSTYLQRFAGKELSGGLSNKVYLTIAMAIYPYTVLATSQGNASIIATPDSTKEYVFHIGVVSGENVNGRVISPMICSAEDYASSSEYVPYAPSNRELYEMIGDINTVLEEVL